MKTYIQPETKVVSIRMTQVMAASPAITLGSGKVNAASVDSREDNSWDIWGNGDYDED